MSEKKFRFINGFRQSPATTEYKSVVLKNNMKLNLITTIKTVIVFVFLLCNTSNLIADVFYYVSPGLRIGWSSSGNFTIDGKISIGINTDDSFSKITFYNITVGFNALAFAKADGNQFNEYNYVQFQAGSSFVEDNVFVSGIGAGFIFNTKGKSDFSPVIRLFLGLLIFPELDIIMDRSKGNQYLLGIRGILPIPISKLD